MQSSNPFYVQPGGDYSEGLQGISELVDAYNKKKQQDEVGAGLASSYDAEHPVDSYMGGTKPVGEGMGAFPVDQSKPQRQSRQELHPDALHTDNFTLEDIMAPMHTQQERMGLEEVGYSPEKHDAMVELADKIKDAPDNEIAGHIKEYIKNGVDNGEDMSAIASTMGMDADTVRSHADAVKTLAKRDAFRRLAIADPNAAYKIMSDEQASRKAELAAQKEARLMDYNDRNLAMQEKRLNAPSYILQSSIDPATGLERVYAVDKKSANAVATGIEGKVKPSGGSGQPSADTPLSPVEENIARQIAEHKLSPLTISGRSPRNMAIMARVNEMDNNYDAKSFFAQKVLQSKMASGDMGKATRSLNVAQTHLDALEKAADDLGSTDVKAFNRGANLLSKEFGGTNIASFKVAKNIVADEVIKAIVGGQNSDADRQHMQELFDEAQSPEQLKAAIAEARLLIGGQLQGMRQQIIGAGLGEDYFNKFLDKRNVESSGGSAGGESPQERIARIKAGRNATK